MNAVSSIDFLAPTLKQQLQRALNRLKVATRHHSDFVCGRLVGEDEYRDAELSLERARKAFAALIEDATGLSHVDVRDALS